MLVNPVLEKIHGKPARDTVGRHPSEVIPVPDTSQVEAALNRVLTTGEPLLNQFTLSTTPADSDPHREHAWSTSYYRLQDQRGRILGVAATVIDDTERHRAASEAARVRRLATLAEAGMRIGSTLDLERTAHELADIAVDALAGVAAHGSVLGDLSLLRVHNPHPFDEDDRDFATELADRAAISIDNARWYRHQRDTALTLQRSLLPRRAPDRGGEIATRYRPADDTSEIGGDWYDVLPLANGGTALVIGDVMGSGVTAAAAMGQLRTATRTLSHLGLPPADILYGLNRLAEDLEFPFATCTYLTCQPTSGTCEFASAGHLPPAVVRPDGTAKLVDPPPGPPRSASGTAGSPPTASTSPPTADSCCTPTASSRPGPMPSTTGSSSS